MKNIKWAFAGLLALTAALWLLADAIPLAPASAMTLRDPFINLTGVFAIMAMSATMILATRPHWLESALGGMDKIYRLHKWLGITALVMSLGHWLWTQAPKWLSELGLMDGRRPHLPDGGEAQAITTVQDLFKSLRHTAEGLGEQAFYVAAALMIVALVKLVPYRWFAYAHRWIAALFLVLVFHSVVLMPFAYWASPIGVVLGVFMAAGSVSAVLSLLGRVGAHDRVEAELVEMDGLPGPRALRLTVKVKGQWPGHEAGQFAFVDLHDSEAPHPFTITSAWENDGRLTFVIKELGDFTSALPRLLKLGDRVTVEGPYGRFTFADNEPEQIWVGGGVGITPFVAALEQRIARAETRPATLYYSTLNPDSRVLVMLRELAHRAGVALHIIDTKRDGLLTSGRIAGDVPGWKNASIWFCGPRGFGDALHQGFVALGLNRNRFHRELFDMR